MYHKLDIHFIPADVLYVNELSLAGKVPYETKDTMEKAITGKIKSKGGILPDDNVRIYVPMDLNADIIMWQLYSLQRPSQPRIRGNRRCTRAEAPEAPRASSARRATPRRTRDLSPSEAEAETRRRA